MSALPYTLSFPSLGCIVVHAGLVPGVELDSQDAQAMSCMRNVVEREGGRGYEPLTLPTQGMSRDFLQLCPVARVVCVHLIRRDFVFGLLSEDWWV